MSGAPLTLRTHSTLAEPPPPDFTPPMQAGLVVRLVFWLWFGAAVAAGHFLWLQRIPPFAVQGIIVTLTALVLISYFRIRSIREWVDALDLRTLVLLHVTRFVGIYFLVLHQQGVLPRAFAVPAGLGDIIVASMALPVVFAPLEPASRDRAVRIWNVVGFVDIMMVIATATRINLTAPAELRALTHLPLSLLPTFLVPLIIATHIIIFARTARSRG
jgi:hypothetical protein